MTQDEIIEMANQAELCQCIWIDDEGPEIASLIAFAKLVSAKEREACAKVAETPIGLYDVVVACGSEPMPRTLPRYLDSHGIAKAIRARGET